MQTNQNWRETYWGGTAEAERLHFEKLARDILKVQARVKKRSGAVNIARAFHAKAILATKGKFRFADDLPGDLTSGFAAPGAEYEATVRISNASGAHKPDRKRDLRGIAVRVKVSDQEYHDLLMTNFPVPHARDANQFVAFAVALSGSRILAIPRLLRSVGPFEAIRMLRNVLKGSKRRVRSVAQETYWSRGAKLWDQAGPVRFLLRPVHDAKSAREPDLRDPDYLRREVGDRLLEGDIKFEFCVQRFVNEAKTPIEDAATEWLETDSVPLVIGQLIVPQQDIYTTEAAETARGIEAMAFNPWHTTEPFRPLGNLNRGRQAVYHASAAHRDNLRFFSDIPIRNKVSVALLTRLFQWVNRYLPWHKMPLLSLQLLNLSLFRQRLRRKNLIDTEPRPAPPKPQPSLEEPIREEVRTARTFDGSYNDLSDPCMGQVGAAFGRNMPPQYMPKLLDAPNPVTVSRELLHRKHFIPARSLNVLAAAWIQFQVHDWVQHKRYKPGEKDITVHMPGGAKWRNTASGPEENVMRIAGDKPLHDAPAGSDAPLLVFGNTTSHWWDGSEVYGTTRETANSLRGDPDQRERSKESWEQAKSLEATLRLPGGYLPEDVNGMEVTGFNESWWLGLSVMHTLFAREHNAVCDALRSAYRSWSQERIYQTARIIVSALIAKIHTVEWTPAILATEAIDVALNANWFGAPSGWLTRLGLWLTDVHAFKGIPQTTPDHHTAPYSLTEDFVTVYRLHPLLPDDYRLYDHQKGTFMRACRFADIQGAKTDEVMRKLKLENVLYSLGIAHPGAIRLHNYPRALTEFQLENGQRIDLSVVDLVRERHRGIPRYNAFRQGLHKPRISRWEDITEDPESVRLLREIYKDIDQIDTMVGLHAETPPTGFGFSDTAFRIFILMATRRLQSDRFLNADFRPEVYSPLGIDWVTNNSMKSVILRHCPELVAFLPRSQSAFAPWRALPVHQESQG
jgi:hypothetical protein